MISILSPLRRSLGVSFEADELELALGRQTAVEVVGERILRAERGERRRLYRLHDELTRRTLLEDHYLAAAPPPEAEPAYA